MPAHKRPIPTRYCKCSLPARYEVFNTKNASLGDFCGPCADDKVRELNRIAEQRAKGGAR